MAFQNTSDTMTTRPNHHPQLDTILDNSQGQLATGKHDKCGEIENDGSNTPGKPWGWDRDEA